jgi:hypothetical protein
MFVIAAGSTQVSLTMPDQLDAGHVEFARQLASQAWAYTVAVERQYRNLPPLPETPVPYTLTAEGGALLDAGPERADLVPLPGGQGGDGMTATCASVRFGARTSGGGSGSAPKPSGCVIRLRRPGKTPATWTSS